MIRAGPAAATIDILPESVRNSIGLNGQLLGTGGVLTVFAGICFSRRRGVRLRWGIGLLGFLLLAFASCSVLQLQIIYRRLSADPLIVARLRPGLVVVVAGALLIFATLFLRDE